MQKKHIIAGFSIVFVIKILLIASIIYLSFTLITIKNELKTDINDIKNTQKILEDKINENQQNTQAQINEISSSLLSTKKDLSEEISQLKADTSSDFSSVIQNVIPGVVSVGTDVSQGSGFIISQDGYVVTNAHVLSRGRYIRILIYEDEKWIPGKLIGYNETMDIALIKIPGTSYNFLEFDDSSTIQVGEKAIAIGNPLGLSFSVSEGIISALHRGGPNNIQAYIQVDTPLNRGNSGGPLINKRGKVIGINNFKLQGSENLGFALESNYAVETINEIFEAANLTIKISN
ncbi:MAG: trypsin-like peptidase domain-containing protein [Candidatus Pacearchaeota archaeon]